MSTYLKQYHAKRADVALAAVRIVHWLQYETNRESKTPIADLMTHYGADNLHLYGSVARSLFGSGIIDDPRLTRKQNGDWWENGYQIGIADGLIVMEGRAHYGAVAPYYCDYIYSQSQPAPFVSNKEEGAK